MKRSLASVRTFAGRVGVSLVVVDVALRLEATRVVRGAGAEVAGPWEYALLDAGLPALSLVVALPIVVAVVAFASLIPLVRDRVGRWAWAIACATMALPWAVLLSTGRKAHVLAVRVPFVLGCAMASAAIGGMLLPRAYAIARRWWFVTPIAGLLIALGAYFADVRVLPRLYPPFHLALEVAIAVGLVMVAEAAAPLRSRRWFAYGADAIAIVGLVAAMRARGRLEWARRGLATFENARRIVYERSPVFARVAELAAKRWPPPPLDLGVDGSVGDPLAQDEHRALFADRRDVLLVTIDALRADHVGAYGYARKTTPAIDALAAEGTLFTHAYTPTPHTSYAISSLMTGKYMRPILALDAETGRARRPDETWAYLLRSYGFRTAAFYPPAVFYVDHDRFVDLERRGLDFEYAKIEFAAPDLRAAQLADYLAEAPKDLPVFAWVHLFEPHEPYVAHPEHPFGDEDVDRYDAEIATADDGVAKLVAAFRKARPNGIVVVTADHGEAFGEHGARYHGTTVYEEQVRVPLVISAPGLVARRRVDRPVQLVDLLPTFLSAHGIPRPPRVRGRDLGVLLALEEPPGGEGVAFSEVEDAAMFARADRRLVCDRKAATCALYDVANDPAELHPIVGTDDEVRAMKRAMGALIGASAELEGAADPSWPEALRRAFAGDAEAAIDVAPLLDDVDVEFRRRAAEALAKLASADTAPYVEHAIDREKDPIVEAWLAIAFARVVVDRPLPPAVIDALVASLVADDRSRARWAALAIGARITGTIPLAASRHRAFLLLAAWFPEARDDAAVARAILDALVTLGSAEDAPRVTPALLDALDDVRLRLAAAGALGLLGDRGAAPLLAAKIASERHVDARPEEALALARVGDRAAAMRAFAWILGIPEVAPGTSDALLAAIGAAAAPAWAARFVPPTSHVVAALIVPKGGAHRVVVAGPKVGSRVRVKVRGVGYESIVGDAGAIVELGTAIASPIDAPIACDVEALDGDPITLVAIVARAEDLPPPKPDKGLSP